MRVSTFLSVFVLALYGAWFGQVATGADDTVQLIQKPDALEVTVGGQPFTVYHFSKTQRKPYFWPVRAADGDILTRPLEKPRDHPHHKGLWFSVDEVNGVKFWAEKGKIENVSVEPVVATGNPASFKVVNNWLGRDGQPILIETTMVSIFANRVIAYDATLTAGKNPVAFEDTKEGLFGFRMVDPLREFSRKGEKPAADSAKTGIVQNADGLQGTAASWGKTSDWVDYYGTLNGKVVGIAIFDNPQNFRRSRYHVRDYGLFSISPFGEKAYTNGKSAAEPVELKAGANLRLRYAIYIHDGDTKTANVAGTYRQYVAASDYADSTPPAPAVSTTTQAQPQVPTQAQPQPIMQAPGCGCVPVRTRHYHRHHHHRNGCCQ